MNVLVVLEKIRILDSRHSALEGIREIDIAVAVSTGDKEQQSQFPRDRHYRPVSGWSLRIDEPIFEGPVGDELRVRIDLVEPDQAAEPLASYTREFTSDPESWLGRHEPQDGHGPEHLDFWEVYYRIEGG